MLEINHLNKQQFKDLLALQAAIKKKYNYTAPIYTHIIRKERPYDCNILLYHGKELIAFASRFLFHEDQVEFALIMHPQHKSDFMAKKLLQSLIKYIPPNYKKTIVISTPHNQRPDIKPDANWEYLYSSHRLHWLSVTPKPEPIADLAITKATSEHFNIFKNIIRTCFPRSTELTADIYQLLMENTQVQIYLLKKQDEFVGAIQINHENKSFRISDVAILPEHREQGYAKYMLTSTLHNLQAKQQKILLDVESSNIFVREWYQRLGMVETNISDFWQIPFQNIF